MLCHHQVPLLLPRKVYFELPSFLFNLFSNILFIVLSATPVLSSEKVEANKAAASLVHDVLQEATTHPHSTAAPAPPVPAPAPAPPSKPAREVLAEMDEVLGIDDLKSNYLARDLMLPTPSTNTFPTSAATAARPSVPSPSKPFLQAADAYLQSHYAPSAHDPRVQYDAARRAGQQQQGRNNTSPMVVRAPSDRELQIQYSNHRLSGHDPQAGSSYNTGASAPPAGLEFAISRTASPQRAAPSTLYEAFHRPAGNGIATDSSGSAFPTDPRRIVAQANAMPLRRPTEGAALEYLRSQKIGVLNTDSGRKYVNPFPQPQVPAFTPPAQNPYYTTSERPRTSPAVSNVDYRATAGNPLLPDRRRTSSPATSAGVARGVHLEHKSMHSVQVPSPTSVAVHERELYLNQMRRLRQNMLQAV